MLLVVTLVFAGLGLAGLGLTWQMDQLVEDLPVYRANIRTKIADVRLVGSGSAIETLQEALAGIKADLGTSETPSGTESRPLVVTSSQVTGLLAFAWLGRARSAGGRRCASTRASPPTDYRSCVTTP